jgi:N-acetylglucosaminyldiphosphoundecaprenol N-acetyl-beta-D-mannosaminyltransferase
MTSTDSDRMREPATAPEKFAVMGHPIHLLNDYSGWLAHRMQHQHGTHVITLNAEMTLQGNQNPTLAAIIQQADLVIPDGAGIVMYLRLYGKKITRCAGIELAAAMIQHAGQSPDSRVFFYGGQPNVAAKAAIAWQQQLPHLNMAGVYDGYVTAEGEAALLTTLQATQPSLILVGIGVPRQEMWITAHRHLCPHAIWIGVGGSFDIWSGAKERAPKWFCDNNLEWLYRLYQEPWRWKRMLALPQFALKAIVYRLQNLRA